MNKSKKEIMDKMGADTEANAEHLDKEFTQVKDAIYSVNENQLAMLK